jgi:pantetheine-phosphate adenylyltransferase
MDGPAGRSENLRRRKPTPGRAFAFSFTPFPSLLTERTIRPTGETPPHTMRHCIYPGTFDPITFGHLDVLARAARLFDRVTVAIAHNPGKGPLFSPEQRLDLVRAVTADLPNVQATLFDGLLVEFARAHDAIAVIRGIRALSDFEFEFNMALMNRHLEPALETIFVMPRETYSYTSSNLVKQVAKLGGDVSHFVPPAVSAALRSAFATK